MIVAHPDDETIWAGGLILSHSGWDWRVECLSRNWDKDRAPKFRRVCEQLGVKGRIHGLVDEPLDKRQSIPLLSRQIARFAGLQPFDFVFFHAFNGEYGHIRHKECHVAVKALLERGRLRTRRAYCFAIKKNRAKIGVPMKRGALEVRLSRAIFAKKKFLMTKVYGFSAADSFEVKSCHAIERFRRIQ